MSKRTKIIRNVCILLVFFIIAFLVVYRYIGVGGKIVQVAANPSAGFHAEYYLLIPDTLKTSARTFLLVESNNTGSVSDSHQKHMDAAHDIIRFGQANGIARKLGVPLLVPCFDRPETDWEMYTHALDRDSIVRGSGTLERIDKQLNAMIDDAKALLASRNIILQDKVLLNGFSASGSFANRFTALHPERVAAVAAGGINSIVILPIETLQDYELIYPVGVADLKEITDLDFNLSEFAAVPQYYYMGAADENDALQFDDAYSAQERKMISAVLGEDMHVRWDNCKKQYDSVKIHATFKSFPELGHETTAEINEEIVLFFEEVIAQAGGAASSGTTTANMAES